MGTAIVEEQFLRTSVYVPAYCLQGEDLPLHVRWKGDENPAIAIRLPPELSIKEAYNVGPDGGRELAKGQYAFESYVVPGYLGLLLKTGRIDSPSKEVEVHFSITSGPNKSLHETSRRVRLFRPLVKCIETPDTVSLTRGSNKFSGKHSHIQLANVGDGTAIVLVKLRKGSDGEIGEPSKSAEFQDKFRRDLLSGLRNAKADFPGHSRLLDEFINLLEQPLALDKKTTRKIRGINQRARAAYKKDKALFSRVVQVLAESYFRNLELVTELSSFLDYLNSIGEGRVVLLNALEALKVSRGDSDIQIELQIADVGFGTYPTISLDTFTVQAEETSEIPVHQLFQWENTDTGDVPDNHAD